MTLRAITLTDDEWIEVRAALGFAARRDREDGRAQLADSVVTVRNKIIRQMSNRTEDVNLTPLTRRPA